MKKLLSLVLALTLLLALAAPALAAGDGVAKALQAYADIIKKADTYDYNLMPNTKFTSLNYQYALVDLKDGNGIPTLLLNLHNVSETGIFENFRVFQYDAASGTVIAPTECLVYGTSAAGGGYNFLGICDGKLTEHFILKMNMEVTLSTYSIVGDKLERSTFWTGQSGQSPYEVEDIAWKEISDTSGFDAYHAPQGPAVVLSAQNLTVDGVSKAVEKYNIDGSNYFKLRDIAYLLNGTAAQFAVGWDAATGTVSIETGKPYTPNGSEMIVGADKSATAQASAQTIKINDEVRSDLSVFNIGGNNFFKLRELGTALGFSVDYDSATNTAQVTSIAPRRSTLADGKYIAQTTGDFRLADGGAYVDADLLETTGEVWENGSPVYQRTGEIGTIFIPGDLQVFYPLNGAADDYADYSELTDFLYDWWSSDGLKMQVRLFFTITNGDVSKLEVHGC